MISAYFGIIIQIILAIIYSDLFYFIFLCADRLKCVLEFVFMVFLHIFI